MTLLPAIVPSAAAAQVVERNLPPASSATAPEVAAPAPSAAGTDETPIAPPLAAIVALAPHDPIRTGSGLDLAAVAGLDTPAAREQLRPFLGRPISRRLIAEITTAITLIYRRAGTPFVSVTTPEQEISGGVLRFQVIEFVAGRLSVNGAGDTSASTIARQIRWRQGEPISATALAQDLAWLNRTPFRRIAATFSPGAAFGESDLALDVVETRPWRVYGGYASSGTVAGGADRLFLGVQAIGRRWLPDVLASYQFTTSPDTGAEPRYRSHAFRLEVPTGPRAVIEATADHVGTHQPVEAFVARQATDEASLAYRAALPSGLAGRNATGDFRLGVEARRVDAVVSFGAVDVRRTRFGLVQALAGLSASVAGPRGEVDAAITVRAGRRVAIDHAASPPGSTSGTPYGYLSGNLSGTIRLPRRLALSTELFAQLTGAALPQTEQIALGGPSLVRGYLLDDGAFDRGIVVRTTLSRSDWRLLPSTRGRSDALTPSIFLDAGVGSGVAQRGSSSAMSVGAGLAYRLGRTVQLSADHACALLASGVTQPGTCRFAVRMTFVH